MKRFLAAVVLLLIPGVLYAFDTKKHAPKIGVLRPDRYDHADARLVADSVAQVAREELRERGLDAYDTKLTFDEVADGKGEDADYYVEIRGTGAEGGSYGGIGIGTWDAGISIEVLVARVAAEVRVYDGPTGDLLHTEALSKKKTTVMPTSISVDGSRLYAVIAMPFVQAAQYRSAARAAAKSAANVLAAQLGDR